MRNWFEYFILYSKEFSANAELEKFVKSEAHSARNFSLIDLALKNSLAIMKYVETWRNLKITSA